MISLEDEFGDVVQKARQGKGLDGGELAVRTGIAPARLQQLEEYAPPTPGEVRRLAGALALDASKLEALRHDPYPEPALKAGAGCSVTRITYEPWRANCYVLANRQGGTCLVVDPGAQAAVIMKTIQRSEWSASGILLTHGHHDHSGAAGELQASLGCPAYIHRADAAFLSGLSDPGVHRVAEGSIKIGSFAVRVVCVPGHTAGSVAYAVSGVLFTGDILFAGSIGRINLGPGSYADALNGIRVKLLSLPRDTLILPGHGIATSVAQELERNPFFS